MYLVKSRTTATLQHCPASEVPPPRQSKGAPNSRQYGNRGEDVVGVARKNDSDGDLAIIGSVGGVEGAAAVVEADVAAELARAGLRRSPQASVVRVEGGTVGGINDFVRQVMSERFSNGCRCY